MTDNRNWRGKTTIAVYGRQTVLDAAAAAARGTITLHRVAVSEKAPKDYRDQLRTAVSLIGSGADDAPEFRVGSPKAVSALSRDARHDQGVAAQVTLDNVISVEAFTGSLKGKRAQTPARVIAIDGVTNPQNVGMIVRAAAAAGFHAVLWPKHGSPWVSGLIIKASAGSLFHVTVALCDTLEDGLAALRERGFAVHALHGDTHVTLWDHAPPHNACYIVGSESEGLSQAARDASDSLVAIPMADPVESLNAATAAAVLAFYVSYADHRGPRPGDAPRGLP